VLDQHVEEAALLWLRHQVAVGQPHFKLKDLDSLDSLLEAHLDGIRIADGDHADAVWKVCERELEWGDPGEIFPAAVLAFENDNRKRIGRVIKAVGDSYENSRALISALAWIPYQDVAAAIGQVLCAADPFLRRVGIAAMIAQRVDPGTHLNRAVDDADELLAERALRGAGELGRVDLVPSICKKMNAVGEPTVRFAAAWSLARLARDLSAIEVLNETVNDSDPHAERALQLITRVSPPESATACAMGLLESKATRRLGIQAIGCIGLPAIPKLLELMSDNSLARVAGESFTMITGVDLAEQKLDAEWPEGFSAGPTDDPEDDDVAMDPDENLPWPNLDALAEWWRENESRFEQGTRYLLGKPITEDWCEYVLRFGYQRQRSAAALEMSIMHPGRPLFNIRAPARRQTKQLGVSHYR
jgi:uncharacterized protein (TIGR02270 family)